MSKTIEKTLILLNKAKISITCFESASAGFLAYKLSQSRYSGVILYASLVCYDLEVKKNILKISPKLIKKYTAESEEITIEMIRKGKKIFQSDMYIACTGLVKKGGSENKEKPVGTLFYVIYYEGNYYSYRILTSGKPQKKLNTLFLEICKSINYILRTNVKKL